MVQVSITSEVPNLNVEINFPIFAPASLWDCCESEPNFDCPEK